MQRGFSISGLLLLLCLSAGQALAQKPVAALVASCGGCHGSEGRSVQPLTPHLAGQQQAYLVAAMKAYRDGQRTGTHTAAMAASVRNLSDADIQAIAAWYAGK